MCLGIPGLIESVEGEDLRRAGTVNFGGVRRLVSLALVPEATAGDYVIVHVGMAISRVDPEEAKRTFEYLQQMDELKDLA